MDIRLDFFDDWLENFYTRFGFQVVGMQLESYKNESPYLRTSMNFTRFADRLPEIFLKAWLALIIATFFAECIATFFEVCIATFWNLCALQLFWLWDFAQFLSIMATIEYVADDSQYIRVTLAVPQTFPMDRS